MGGREKSGKIWRRVIYYMVDGRLSVGNVPIDNIPDAKRLENYG